MLKKFLTHYEKLMAIPAATNRVDGLVDYVLKLAKKCKYSAETLPDGTVRVHIPSVTKKSNRHIAYGAHLDRIGLMVDKLHDDGTIEMSAIGGLYPGHVIDGVTATIVTKKESFPGVISHVEAPIHALGLVKFKKREQEWKKLRLRLDACIGITKKGKAYLKKLGVEVGDIIWLDPQLRIDKKYETIRSRWVDNTMACATLLALMEEWAAKKSKPTFPTDLVFTVAEESGMGGSSACHDDVTDFIAVDVSQAETSEDITKADIACKAGPFPYSQQLIDEMCAAAKQAKTEVIKYTITGGGTDAEQARRAGFVGRTICVGVPCYGMHSIESCVFSSVKGLLAMLNAHATT